MTRVSIVMPAFNAERYLGEAIQSVLTQGFRDWELFVVDDGSWDATSAVATSFSDGRVKLIRQANCGTSSARNAALHAATGYYIAFLDADDLMLADALGSMVEYLDNHPGFDAVIADGYFCDSKGAVIGRLKDSRRRVQEGCILESLVLDPTVVAGIITVMVRAESIRSRGLAFDTRLSVGEDWDFLIHLATDAAFGFLDRPTCMYRVHGGNTTARTGVQRWKEGLAEGRLKIMNEHWFDKLSPETRTAFLSHLLFDILDGRTAAQRQLVEGSQFRMLPSTAQAHLLSLFGKLQMRTSADTPFAVVCLRRSLALSPRSRHTKLILRVAELSPTLAAAGLSVWQFLRRVATTAIGRDRSNLASIPDDLRPRAT